MHFRGESDAIIVKGIVSLLLRVLDGQTPQDILDSDLYFIKEIGLSEHLSPHALMGLSRCFARCASLLQPSLSSHNRPLYYSSSLSMTPPKLVVGSLALSLLTLALTPLLLPTYDG